MARLGNPTGKCPLVPALSVALVRRLRVVLLDLLVRVGVAVRVRRPRYHFRQHFSLLLRRFIFLQFTYLAEAWCTQRGPPERIHARRIGTCFATFRTVAGCRMQWGRRRLAWGRTRLESTCRRLGHRRRLP